MGKLERRIIYGIAFFAFGVLMAGWHWLLTGINADFGAGVAVGGAFSAGMLGLLFKSIRDIP